METRQLFPAGKFAQLARITNKTLHYYDAIGVLPPASRGDNHYRYYSTEQLSIVNLIRILQELGLSLDEIRDIKNRRAPAFVEDLLSGQIGEIDKKIEEWTRARKLLLTFREAIRTALNADETAVTIQFLPSEAIILGPLNDHSRGRDDYDSLRDFYYAMRNRYPSLDLNYPVWAVFSQDRVKRGDWKYPDRYYFYNPEGYDRKPAALYAVGYARGNYGQTDALYKRLIGYIEENDFEICGDAYEEYPLNELCVAQNANYLIRVSITVRKKGGAA